MLRFLGFGLAVGCALALAPRGVRADFVISFDENGRNTVNGVASILSFASGTDPLDPTNGLKPIIASLSSSIPTPVAGDVVIRDGDLPMDLIRFTDKQIIFYSDPGDAADKDLADVGLPTSRQTNLFTSPEVTLPSPAQNGLVYTPTANQPGYLGEGTRYTFVSDGRVPEPASLVTLGIGLGLTGLALSRRRHRSV